MKKLHKFLIMNHEERRVFMTAVAAMAIVRAALLVFPVHALIGAMGKINRRFPRRRQSSLAATQVARRVSQAPRFSLVPTTCLSRAIAGHFVMTRWNFAPELRIGVAKTDGRFEAHAWLECPHGLVIGNPSPEGKTYTLIPSLERFFA